MVKSSAALLLAAATACRPDATGEEVTPLEVTATALGPLSWRLDFSTDEPTTATALWWEGEGATPPERYAYVEDGAVALTHHDLHVYGLRPGRAHRVLVRAMGEDGAAYASAPLTIETPSVLPLPAHSNTAYAEVRLRTRVFAPRPDLMTPNTVIATNLALSSVSQLAQVVIWDRRGHPVWTHFTTDETRGGSGDVDVLLVNGEGADYRDDNGARALLVGGGIPADTRTAIVGLDHQVQQEGPVQGGFISNDGFMHHDLDLVDGVFVTLTTTMIGRDPSDWLVLHDPGFDPLVNADPRQGVLWDLVVSETLGTGYFSNSLGWDPDSATVTYYAKPEGILFAIDQATSEPRWVFGPGVARETWPEGVVTIDTVQDSAGCGDVWLAGAHHVQVDRVAGDGPDEVRVLAHDNGEGSIAVAERGYTRALEYRLDLARGTADLLWAYPCGEPPHDALEPLWYKDGIWGDIERVGDNVLLVSGEPWEEEDAEAPTVSVISELAPDYEAHSATLAWRMVLEADDGQDDLLFPGFYAGQAIRGLWGQAGGEDLDFAPDGEEPLVLSSWSNLVEGGW
ncbi:MAG: hypothetical protein ABIO70_30025 [Pseudomonadota bacterium]